MVDVAVVVDSGLKCMVELEKGRIRRWRKEDMVDALLIRPMARRRIWIWVFSLADGEVEIVLRLRCVDC
jgi:hypothetical protein